MQIKVKKLAAALLAATITFTSGGVNAYAFGTDSDDAIMNQILEHSGYSSIIYDSNVAEAATASVPVQKAVYITKKGPVTCKVLTNEVKPFKAEVIYNNETVVSEIVTENSYLGKSKTQVGYINEFDFTADKAGVAIIKITFYDDVNYLLYVAQNQETETDYYPEDEIEDNEGEVIVDGELVETPYIENMLISTGKWLNVQSSDVYSYADGIQWQVYKGNSTTPLETGTTSKNAFVSYKANGRAVYHARVRAYKIDTDGKKYYSPWSERSSVIATTKAKPETQSTIKAHSIKIKYYKVTGATKYIIYASKNKESGFKKVGTTTKTSYKVTKVGKKKLNLKNNRMYFRIVAVGKADDQTTIQSDPYRFSAIMKTY